MIKDIPHTYFLGYLPVALAFLQGRFVGLGFENLGLSAPEYLDSCWPLAARACAFPLHSCGCALSTLMP